ncbi:hypothetical protein [Crossiella sp. CA198]|uniref:hypothetical protein n=1 Tax=Crossiella sp. CA198 TaxID=3455607 RepID=UPI003F8D81B2
MSSHQDCPEPAIQRLLAEPAMPEHTTSSAFRTVAALTDGHLDPLQTGWLLDTQHRDGSWGGAIPFAPDRCLNTLAAVVALTEADRADPADGPDVLPATHAGVAYLWNALSGVREDDPRRPPHFATHLSILLHRARELDLPLPYPNLADLAATHCEKPLAPNDSSLCLGTVEELETLWTALTLARSGVPGELLRPSVAALGVPSGDGLANTSAGAGGGAEADRLAILLALRGYCGLPVDQDLIGLLTSSDVDPIHLIGALATDPGRHSAALADVLGQLRDHRSESAYWQHRWHLSPYHATWLALAAADGLDDGVRADAVDWLMSTQRADGSWGVGGGTVEETAYAVSSVLAMAPGSLVMRQAVAMGMDHLEAWRNEPWPELWVGAVLFAPRRVVRAAVLGARYRYSRWLGEQGAEHSCEVLPAGQ